MRHMYGADWAFGLVGALENTVREQCPQLLRSWPLLQTFDWEVFSLPHDWIIVVVRDKLNGIPSGPGNAKPLERMDHPPVPPTVGNIALWQFYLQKNLNLRPTDAGFLVPVRDSGKSNPLEDYGLFTTEEQFFWHAQLNHIFEMQRGLLESMVHQSSHIGNITVTGPNARVNIGATDQSINAVGADVEGLFDELRELLEEIPDRQAQTHITAAIDGMEASAGRPGFVEHYKRFISLTADHISVFAPLIGRLSSLLGA